MSDFAVDLRDLRKQYGDLVAVDGLTLQVPRGSIFAVVGPNGAGKTTTIEIAEGLKTADSGTVEVLGLTMPLHVEALRPRVGVQLQTTAMFERLTVRETIELYRSFYRDGAEVAAVLDAVQLGPKTNTRVSDLSGGLQQRLAIALALVNTPELLFLDEPTANLDPQARRVVWALLDDLRSRGRTVVFSTHYMDEAEKISDQVAIIDRGRLIAQDTPARLIRQLERSDVIEFACDPEADATRFRGVPGAEEVTVDGALVLIYTNDVSQCLPAAVERGREAGISMNDLRVRSASLEDVFIERTGHGIRE